MIEIIIAGVYGILIVILCYRTMMINFELERVSKMIEKLVKDLGAE